MENFAEDYRDAIGRPWGGYTEGTDRHQGDRRSQTCELEERQAKLGKLKIQNAHDIIRRSLGSWSQRIHRDEGS